MYFFVFDLSLYTIFIYDYDHKSDYYSLPYLFNISSLTPNCTPFPNSAGKLPQVPCKFTNESVALQNLDFRGYFAIVAMVSSDNDVKQLKDNLLVSPIFNHPLTTEAFPLLVFDGRKGSSRYPAYYYNLALSVKHNSPYLIFTHPDVYLPENFIIYLGSIISKMNMNSTGTPFGILGSVGTESATGTIRLNACDLCFTRCWNNFDGKQMYYTDTHDEIVVIIPTIIGNVAITFDECHPNHHLLASSIDLSIKSLELGPSYTINNFVLHKGRTVSSEWIWDRNKGQISKDYLSCKFHGEFWDKKILPVHSVNFGTITEYVGNCTGWRENYCNCQAKVEIKDMTWEKLC